MRQIAPQGLTWLTRADHETPKGKEEHVGVFTAAELDYLRSERRLARIATVDRHGRPHVTPVGWQLDDTEQVVEIRGIDLSATKKFRDVARSGRAATVIDDVLPPWQPRGIEIRATAEAVDQPEPVIRLYPTRIISWGLDGGHGGPGQRTARDVPTPNAS